MKGAGITVKHISKARVSHGELYTSLRRGGKISPVKAAVLETAGEVSRLMPTYPTYAFDAVLLSEVQQ